MKRIQDKLKEDKKIISIYFTAGFPELDDTMAILENLEKAGADMVEIGLPFSDPLADGPTIQASSAQALQNGMTSELLFGQLKGCRESIKMPLIIMGYFNPILQFGVENFLKKCQETGIDGLIIPDLPLEVYLSEYKALFERYSLANIFLITPQTSEERIRQIDESTDSFIYIVSSSSVTGGTREFDSRQFEYFERISALNLKNPQIIGFGISSRASFEQAARYQKGAIIGSSFVANLKSRGLHSIADFVNAVLPAESK
ncbi:MAG TPA: tryptophan synthase subunit alpha [Flavobacterium sp.]|nr:tryptophan synthase subunit alpha [Flavobacterium sp.]